MNSSEIQLFRVLSRHEHSEPDQPIRFSEIWDNQDLPDVLIVEFLRKFALKQHLDLNFDGDDVSISTTPAGRKYILSDLRRVVLGEDSSEFRDPAPVILGTPTRKIRPKFNNLQLGFFEDLE